MLDRTVGLESAANTRACACAHVCNCAARDMRRPDQVLCGTRDNIFKSGTVGQSGYETRFVAATASFLKKTIFVKLPRSKVMA